MRVIGPPGNVKAAAVRSYFTCNSESAPRYFTMLQNVIKLAMSKLRFDSNISLLAQRCRWQLDRKEIKWIG
ncbi:MAG: hypothetical protein DMG34_21260 [Acidobacteria bacterium]|nr:MAG: hypothetical protein DMG34_21260 [Acidobacteriota bacterium]